MTNEEVEQIFKHIIENVDSCCEIRFNDAGERSIDLQSLEWMLSEIKKDYIITPNDIKSKSELFGYYN